MQKIRPPERYKSGKVAMATKHGNAAPRRGGERGAARTARPWGGWPVPFYGKSYP